MKAFVSSVFLSSILASSAFSQADASKNYYWIGAYEGLISSASSWSEDEAGYDNPVSEAPGENAILNVNKDNKQTAGQLSNPARIQASTGKRFLSLVSTVNTEIHVLQTMNFIGDYVSRVDSDYIYNGNTKQLRFANDNSSSEFKFLNVGGDMTLSTRKYHTARVSFVKGTAMRMDVGGALNFEYLGSAADAGFHTFDMRDSQSSTGSNFIANLGGMSSSGRAVLMTAYKGVVADFVFQNDSSGAFKGGDFEGVFANYTSAESTVNFSMGGAGRQSVAVYSAANAAAHGIGGMSGKTDMNIGSVEVYGGEFFMDSELAVNSVLLDGGSLGFSSPEKVGSFTANGGTIVYSGKISADTLSVAADSVKVVFSDEDLAAHDIVVFDFGYLSDDFDANEVFAAYDASGNRLGGEFFLDASAGGAGTLSYSVPEPSALAAMLGLFAFSAACAARRQRR